MGLKSNDRCPYKGQRGEEREGHLNTEAEPGETRHAPWDHQEVERARGGPQSLHRVTALLTLASQISGLWNRESTSSCCLKTPSLWRGDSSPKTGVRPLKGDTAFPVLWS